MKRIYFLGGSPGSGKTTLTDAVHKNLGIAVYHTDDIFLTADIIKNKQPHMSELRESSDPLDIWNRSPQDCLAFWLGYYEEAFHILMENLYNMQENVGSLIAEGVCILPHFLEKIGCVSNAYFLINSPAFLEKTVSQKLKQMPAAVSDKIYHNMLYAFSGVSQIMMDDCERIGLPYLIMKESEDYAKI